MTDAALQVRLHQKTRHMGGCLIWDGAVGSGGYGTISVAGKTQLAHRVAYEVAKGKIGDGLQIDHLCRNRLCINPDHLEAVLPRVNILRGIGITAVHARQTHCLNGHEFNKANTLIVGKGGRQCIQCNRERLRKRRASQPKRRRKGYKLTIKDVEIIKTMCRSGRTQSDTARLYGVNQSLVSRILSGRTWRDVS